MKNKILKEIDRVIKEKCEYKFEGEMYYDKGAIKHLKSLKKFIIKLK